MPQALKAELAAWHARRGEEKGKARSAGGPASVPTAAGDLYARSAGDGGDVTVRSVPLCLLYSLQYPCSIDCNAGFPILLAQSHMTPQSRLLNPRPPVPPPAFPSLPKHGRLSSDGKRLCLRRSDASYQYRMCGPGPERRWKSTSQRRCVELIRDTGRERDRFWRCPCLG